MRVLLVNNGGSGSSEFSMTEARFPIGLGYLSAMLKQNGHTTELVDRFCDHDLRDSQIDLHDILDRAFRFDRLVKCQFSCWLRHCLLFFTLFYHSFYLFCFDSFDEPLELIYLMIFKNVFNIGKT